MNEILLQKIDETELDQLGRELHQFASELYPICRSITGQGIRQTLVRIGERIPLTVQEVPTGTEVFDWTVPKEWSIRDAYIKDADGNRVVDFQRHNLHVVNYSTPISGNSRWRNFGLTCTRFPSIRTGFHIAPLITSRTGAFAFHRINCWR